VVTEVTYCRHCGSDDLVKNGFAPNNGKQKYLCHACGRQSRAAPSPNGYPEERSSLRGVRYTSGISSITVLGWLKKG
jgi:transposase-like protein